MITESNKKEAVENHKKQEVIESQNRTDRV